MPRYRVTKNCTVAAYPGRPHLALDRDMEVDLPEKVVHPYLVLIDEVPAAEDEVPAVDITPGTTAPPDPEAESGEKPPLKGNEKQLLTLSNNELRTRLVALGVNPAKLSNKNQLIKALVEASKKQ
jgi:hypothetical protein